MNAYNVLLINSNNNNYNIYIYHNLKTKLGHVIILYNKYLYTMFK